MLDTTEKKLDTVVLGIVVVVEVPESRRGEEERGVKSVRLEYSGQFPEEER